VPRAVYRVAGLKHAAALAPNGVALAGRANHATTALDAGREGEREMMKHMHLNLFIHGRGHHEAAWRHPDASPLPLTDIPG
jgi:hypothetical protein